jgi:D-arabinose 1-dehydrogenase-like Zn-dependent alcohol dehydrogenase
MLKPDFQSPAIHDELRYAVRKALLQNNAKVAVPVKGWHSGTSIDSQDTLAFSMRTGVRPMIATYPLEQVAEAYDRMRCGKARFRVVLTIGH